MGWLLFLSAIFLAVAFLSYLKTGRADQSVVESLSTVGVIQSGIEVQNALGVYGAYVSHHFIFEWFGIGSLLIPPLLLVMAVRIILRKTLAPIFQATLFTFFYLIWTSTLLGYFLLDEQGISTWSFLSGGIGYDFAVVLQSLMGWGTLLLLLFAFVGFNMYLFNVTHLPVVQRVLKRLGDALATVHLSSGGITKEKNSATTKEKEIPPALLEKIRQEIELEEQSKYTSQEKSASGRPAEESQEELVPVIGQRAEGNTKKENEEIILEIDLPDKKDATEPTPVHKTETIDEMEVTKAEFTEKQSTEQLVNYDPTLELPNYKFPTPDLLKTYPRRDVQVSKDELEQNKNKIVETLINFKIGIQSIKATIGPTVTLYEIVPKAGVKISKIKNLEDDIALSLSALGIRIIAPIPGRGTIGIEVPNKNRELVDIRSVITTEKFMMSDYALPIVLGKTVSNEVFATDLSKMPHLLMAGATGQGKSVGINMILASLLYKKHPSQLKFVLVDPKKVELTLFNKIEKHFLAKLPDSEESIITDTSKVVNSLNSLCIEMDQRYDLLKNAGCRNIKEYNRKFEERRLNPEKGYRYLPYIVLIIDELADLMMTAGKEVETPIARLAQLARAIGIHLIVATQRPSVNVITGIIKANFPARLSYRVTSKVDSRTILDTGGADQLIGMGDMLLSMGSEIIRLQCAFVDTPEIDRLCDFISEQRGYDTAYYLPEYVGEEESGIGETDLKDRDALFADAARLLVVHQQGSTSLIQRKMKLGYNRAGRLIDQLEAAGVVGPFEGSKAREVLIPDEYALEQLLNEIERKY